MKLEFRKVLELKKLLRLSMNFKNNKLNKINFIKDNEYKNFKCYLNNSTKDKICIDIDEKDIKLKSIFNLFFNNKDIEKIESISDKTVYKSELSCYLNKSSNIKICLGKDITNINIFTELKNLQNLEKKIFS